MNNVSEAIAAMVTLKESLDSAQQALVLADATMRAEIERVEARIPSLELRACTLTYRYAFNSATNSKNEIPMHLSKLLGPIYLTNQIESVYEIFGVASDGKVLGRSLFVTVWMGRYMGDEKYLPEDPSVYLVYSHFMQIWNRQIVQTSNDFRSIFYAPEDSGGDDSWQGQYKLYRALNEANVKMIRANFASTEMNLRSTQTALLTAKTLASASHDTRYKSLLEIYNSRGVNNG